jgi:hypothetical protein
MLNDERPDQAQRLAFRLNRAIAGSRQARPTTHTVIPANAGIYQLHRHSGCV